MATHEKNNIRRSMALERTNSWILNKQFPSDVAVQVGEKCFNLHKFMLVAKSNHIRKLIIEAKKADLTKIDLSGIPGGAETFEKAAKYCYGVNFEITVHNVAALRCAAEYLQMSDEYSKHNLISRTNDFLEQVALSSLCGAIAVLKSCEELLPMAEDLQIVSRCVDLISFKVCKEASFPSTSPANWWTEELSVLNVMLFGKIINAMRKRGAKASSIASALITYAERSLRDLVRDHSGCGTKDSDVGAFEEGNKQREILETLVALSPADKSCFPVNFLCCLLRCAIFLKASNSCKNELEKRISVVLEHVSVDDLLILSFTYDGERLFDLDSVRRIISGFVEKEKNMAVFNGGDFREVFSAAMQRVVKTVDTYLGEIAIYAELSISKFNGIANLVPKGARKIDDDLYRAIDIYLKAHPNLDEIEREKVCSIMDPLKLSHEARLHASKNKRLPVQIVLHALYYDQLKLRSGANDRQIQNAAVTRSPLIRDVSLAKENEALRSELMMMKSYISDIQKNQGTTSTPKGNPRTKPSLFSSMSKTLGKLNPFRSKDTLNIEDIVDITKPRRRRFSIS